FLNKKIRYVLDEEETMIIEKRFFSKKSTYKEIGDVLNFSLETIRNKEKKAFSKLKKELKKDLIQR
ncbi:MAG: RNA polymerase sporulation sigma factor SigE, partial [Spirochaetae bacterium HGW-Spirochaetae-6]